MTNAAEQSWSGLVLRPVLLFVAGFAINASLHEIAHALAAHWAHIPSTLHHVYVSVDLDGQPLLAQLAVRAAGPLFSLAFGLLCWFAHRAGRDTWAELPLFYLAVFGVATFLGGLTSTSFAGDFSNAATALELARWIRNAVSVTGLVLLAAFSYDVGRELRESVPARIGGFAAMLVIVVVPALVGTALLLLAYQPMEQAQMLVRVSEAAFWLVAAIGAAVGSVRPARGTRGLQVRLGDWVFAWASVAALRVLALGIPINAAPAPPLAPVVQRAVVPPSVDVSPVPAPPRRPRSR